VRVTPEVSVLMAVRDGGPWIAEAVRSVLAQTLADLELIVIDDGSEDGTREILAAATDPRVTVEHGPRRGLTVSLRRAAALARAPLLARLDADDVAVPARFARQRAFLASHADVGLLGGGVREIDLAGNVVRRVLPPESDAELRRRLIRENPFVHSAVMMRREVYERVGGYDARVSVAQDYDLWLRMSRVTRLANLPEIVVVRRLVPGRVGATRERERLRTEIRLRWLAVRAGAYPWWAIVFVVRPALALAVPSPVRRVLRRVRGGERR
jgi:glycosyltransferase involved in cell wall biosynthesis